VTEHEGHSPVNVEVVGWRGARIAKRAVCESEQEAAAIAEHWAELDFTRIEIEDLSVHHRPDEILEPGVDIGPGEANEPSPARGSDRSWLSGLGHQGDR
jgi:hypothetical protein